MMKYNHHYWPTHMVESLLGRQRVSLKRWYDWVQDQCVEIMSVGNLFHSPLHHRISQFRGLLPRYLVNSNFDLLVGGGQPSDAVKNTSHNLPGHRVDLIERILLGQLVVALIDHFRVVNCLTNQPFLPLIIEAVKINLLGSTHKYGLWLDLDVLLGEGDNEQ